MLALMRLFLNPYFFINDPETLQVIFSLRDKIGWNCFQSIQVKSCKLRKTSFQTDWSAKVVVIASHRGLHACIRLRVLAEGVQPRAVNPSFLAGRLPVLEAVFLSPYFKRDLPISENNQFSNIKVTVYANDMRKNSLSCFHN